VVAPSALSPTLARGATALKTIDLYADGGVLSKTATDLHGKEVAFQGFMAPPLKPNSKFFVLTTEPMAVCPFCAAIEEWPEDIVVVYTKRVIDQLPFDLRIQVTGKLDLGPWIDPATGFVSKVRILEAEYRGVPTVTQGGVRVFRM
jgi:hypothetical protein